MGGFPGGSENKESTRNAGALDSTPGFERSPGEGNSYPLQYSCPENSMDRGTWRAIAHEISELDTPEWLSIKTLWTAWIQEKQQGSKEKARCCPVPDEVCDVVQVGMLVSEPPHKSLPPVLLPHTSAPYPSPPVALLSDLSSLSAVTLPRTAESRLFNPQNLYSMVPVTWISSPDSPSVSCEDTSSSLHPQLSHHLPILCLARIYLDFKFEFSSSIKLVRTY